MYENTLDKIKNHQVITLVEILAFFSYHVAQKIRKTVKEDKIEIELRDFLLYDNVMHALLQNHPFLFQRILLLSHIVYAEKIDRYHKINFVYIQNFSSIILQ